MRTTLVNSQAESALLQVSSQRATRRALTDIPYIAVEGIGRNEATAPSRCELRHTPCHGGRVASH